MAESTSLSLLPVVHRRRCPSFWGILDPVGDGLRHYTMDLEVEAKPESLIPKPMFSSTVVCCSQPTVRSLVQLKPGPPNCVYVLQPQSARAIFPRACLQAPLPGQRKEVHLHPYLTVCLSGPCPGLWPASPPDRHLQRPRTRVSCPTSTMPDPQRPFCACRVSEWMNECSSQQLRQGQLPVDPRLGISPPSCMN